MSVKIEYSPDFIQSPALVKAELTTADRIKTACDAVRDMLLVKNASYGDSALHPAGIFARGKAEDLIRVRIDDKLSRIKNAPDAFGEDAIGDLIGYLVLLKLALEDERAAEDNAKKQERRP
jgi:hypothetical protein